MGQETPMTLTRAESTLVAMYEVNLEVKERVLMVTKWAARQVVLTGQTLEVMDGEKLKFACNTTYCTVRLLEPLDASRFFPFQLVENGKVKVTLNAPTSSARDDFLSHLEKSVVSGTWAVETKDTWDSFLSVAAAINEKKALEGKFRVKPSNVSIQQVTEHMLDMKEVYDVVAGLPDVDSLYELFLSLERDYGNGALGSFAHTVHLLHPVLYSKGLKAGSPLVDTLTRCPHVSCGAALPLPTVYLMHIRSQAINCPSCGRGVLYETFNLAAFVAKHPLFTVHSTLQNVANKFVVAVPNVPDDGSWTTFLRRLRRKIAAGASMISREGVSIMRLTIQAAVKAYRQNVLGRFHLDLVQGMFRQLDFVNKMCPHFEYWTHPDVITALCTS
ncbi:hypothetical protein SDRG_10759 [Saprolegnia diclina VS20]|uniref:Uncharacterized protein n=1 Tax=Saprolegnia diclina (strain VS20) TaxID=1156394 RepID=T0Q180_SAPDV|nr:hypothetical protein SDRG_10759 [Saprolegnia diclina VS20]EQC31589.1 hypothetical protein SDRG_10759 [Saprolegnia diclina VS20]|eukprot:XP_008614988.1 hypothetical protein SDRG_10759 [Saprolegnia diclina VS20]